MGWFDDSDSDEEKVRKRRRKDLLDWTGPSGSDLHHITTSTTEVTGSAESHTSISTVEKLEDGDNVVEDPLDTYMKDLADQNRIQQVAAPDKTRKQSERLDLNAEAEEATDHWIEPVGKEDSDTYGQESVVFTAATTPFDLPNIQKVFWQPSDTSQGREWRLHNQISVSHGACDPIREWKALRTVFHSSADVCSFLTQQFDQLTAVQAQALPILLSGRDAIITAQTGQGKTLAYLLPIMAHVHNDPPQTDPAASFPVDSSSPQKALVLVPTRELALQVYQQAQPLLKILGLTGKAIIGGSGGSFDKVTSGAGTSKYHLQLDLQNHQHALVIATPGRLLDVLSGFKKSLPDYLADVSFCVLDEADKMLSMGFQQQVDRILHRLPHNRQTVLLSATMGRRVEQVAQQWLNSIHVRIAVGRTGQTSHSVEQHVMVLPNQSAKQQFLVSMLPTFTSIGRTLVFVATREGCERLGQGIQAALPSLPLVTLHGDKHQIDRNAALKQFSTQEVNLMIATDVAGRGLDVPDVMTVVNFDPAKTLDAHVHRCGRAGRLSNNQQQVGSAYTLLTKRDSAFAGVLRNAFQREGREICPELESLAGNPLREGSIRPANSQTGLGYSRDDRH